MGGSLYTPSCPKRYRCPLFLSSTFSSRSLFPLSRNRALNHMHINRANNLRQNSILSFNFVYGDNNKIKHYSKNEKRSTMFLSSIRKKNILSDYQNKEENPRQTFPLSLMSPVLRTTVGLGSDVRSGKSYIQKQSFSQFRSKKDRNSIPPPPPPPSSSPSTTTTTVTTAAGKGLDDKQKKD